MFGEFHCRDANLDGRLLLLLLGKAQHAAIGSEASMKQEWAKCAYCAIVTELVGVKENGVLAVQASLTVQHALRLQTCVEAVVIPEAANEAQLKPHAAASATSQEMQCLWIATQLNK